MAEPGYIWAPLIRWLDRLPRLPRLPCWLGGHRYRLTDYNGVHYLQCVRCPHRKVWAQ